MKLHDSMDPGYLIRCGSKDLGPRAGKKRTGVLGCIGEFWDQMEICQCIKLWFLF